MRNYVTGKGCLMSFTLGVIIYLFISIFIYLFIYLFYSQIKNFSVSLRLFKIYDADRKHQTIISLVDNKKKRVRVYHKEVYLQMDC